MSDYQVLFEGLSEQKRELLEIISLFAFDIKKEVRQDGRAKHNWIIDFGGSGGWSAVVTMRQDRITPFAVLTLLQDYIPELDTKVLNFLRKVKDHKLKQEQARDERD